MDELILLPEGRAGKVHLDSRNGRMLYRLLAVFTAWAIIEALIRLADGPPLQALRSVATLLLVTGSISCATAGSWRHIFGRSSSAT